jgi:hypothetical protein
MGRKKKVVDNPCPGPAAEASCPCGDMHKEPEPWKLTKDDLDITKPLKRVWPTDDDPEDVKH